MSAYTKDVLDRVCRAGVAVVGVTGRGPRLTGLCRGDIPAASHLVLAQGAYVVNGAKVLRSRWMDGAVVASVLATLEAEVGPLALMVEAEDGHQAPLWGERHIVWPFPDAWQVRDREALVREPVRKAFLRSATLSADEVLAVARRVVPPTLCEVTQAGLGYIEVCPPGVTKASGLAVVAAELGVDAADVLVFGDMPNDVSMFSWAGHGVAVANAHPELLAVADEVTVSNDDDGVAVYLERTVA